MTAPAKANLNGDRRACAADRTRRCRDRDWVFPSASILAKCKTAPTMMLVLAMLKVDCKSTGGMRLGDGRGNARGRGRYGLEEGDSRDAGSATVAGAGWGGWVSAGSGDRRFSATGSLY